jgi:hypothetical protein
MRTARALLAALPRTLLCALTLAAPSCAAEGPTDAITEEESVTPPPAESKADQPNTDPRFACEDQDDCRVVSRTCCASCSELVSVNRWYVEEFAASEQECADAQCGAPCAEGEPVCIHGECAHVEVAQGPPCETLGELQCSLADDCEPLYSIVAPTLTCQPPNQPRTFIECRDTFECRTSTFECAIDPDDDSINWFLGQCPPSGWEACPDACQTLCEGRQEHSCQSEPECLALYGDRAGAFCTGADEYMGCVPTRGCAELEVCAGDPLMDDSVWFPNSCKPTGWDAVPCNATCD